MGQDAKFPLIIILLQEQTCVSSQKYNSTNFKKGGYAGPPLHYSLKHLLYFSITEFFKYRSAVGAICSQIKFLELFYKERHLLMGHTVPCPYRSMTGHYSKKFIHSSVICEVVFFFKHWDQVL